MADEWAAEMRAQFEQLQRKLTEVIKTELRGTEERLSQRLDERLSQRLDERAEALEERMTRRFDERSQDLEERLTQRFDERSQGLEERLSRHIDGQLQATEERLSRQYTVAVEEVRGEVRLFGEAFGGTLEVIRRDIRGLDTKFTSVLDVHGKVLAEHSRDIAELKRGRDRA
ncbi:MAG: hypothetical protein ACRD2N_01430 [Vicinamibacterales bacterium]